ncbi:hypothetical protein [Lactobacillus taiwanensis]|nr:hypothetical protein [Lactobacillus taiwanensis]
MTDNHEHITKIDPNKVQNRSSRSVSKQEPTKPTKAPSRDD